MKTEIKYAPATLSDVIYPNKATELRIQAFAAGDLEGNILLYGPNGAGKTTVASLLPYAISGTDAYVEDKDFDKVLKQSDIKSYLKKACSMSNLFGSSKFFMVFNEFDNAKFNLDKLWNAMDSIQEELMVIITTNNPTQVHQSIRSRCTLIEMPALSPQALLARSQYILKTEGLVLPDKQVLHYLTSKQHTGDIRQYMGLLDELLFLDRSGLSMPNWKTSPSTRIASVPTLRVVPT